MLREVVGFMFIVTYVITAASGIIGVSAAFNALSLHSLCTVWFAFISTIIIAGFASVRKFSHIGWLTWVGFVSILAAVLIVVYVPIPFPNITTTTSLTTPKHRGNNPLPPSHSPPNRSLRPRLPRNRLPDFRSRNNRLGHDIRLQRRNIRLPARDLRNAQAQRLPESGLPVHVLRNILLSRLRTSNLRLVRKMDRLSSPRQRRHDHQTRRLRHRPTRPDRQRLALRTRSSKVPLRSHPAPLAPPPSQHSRALGYVAELHDRISCDCIYLGVCDSYLHVCVGTSGELGVCAAGAVFAGVVVVV